MSDTRREFTMNRPKDCPSCSTWGENEQLRAENAALAAALVAKDEALRYHMEQTRPIQKTIEALALQPHADLVRKMKADAVQKYMKWAGMEGMADEYANRIQRGEVG